jgi:diguanylate cyclase (GGDEF)-like protein/PAS domain S-box-containing protein
MLVKGKKGASGIRRRRPSSRTAEGTQNRSGAKKRQGGQRRVPRHYSDEIIRSCPDVIIAVDVDGRIIEFNKAAERIFGYEAGNAVGRDAGFLFNLPDEAAIVFETVESAARFDGEVANRRKDGSVFRSLFSASALNDAQGSFMGYVAIVSDVTDHRTQEESRIRSEKFLNTIFDSIKDPFSIVGRDYTIVRVNDAYADMRNRRCDELIGRRCYEVLHNRTSVCDDCVVEKTFQSSDPCAKDKLLALPGGGETWMEIYTYPILNEEGRVSHVIEYTRDITCRWKSEEERKKLIERLEYLSSTDVLTGLFNRRALIERLAYEVERAVRYKGDLSLILCDVDYFKEINDSYGHTSGDNALKAIAGILGNSLRSADLVGRYGGDEFMVILPETAIKGAVEFAERIRSSLQAAKVRVKGRKTIGMSLSLGVASLRCRKGKGDVDSLIRQADTALYSAKRTGRNRVCVSPA